MTNWLLNRIIINEYDELRKTGNIYIKFINLLNILTVLINYFEMIPNFFNNLFLKRHDI